MMAARASSTVRSAERPDSTASRSRSGSVTMKSSLRAATGPRSRRGDTVGLGSRVALGIARGSGLGACRCRPTSISTAAAITPVPSTKNSTARSLIAVVSWLPRLRRRSRITNMVTIRTSRTTPTATASRCSGPFHRGVPTVPRSPASPTRISRISGSSRSSQSCGVAPGWRLVIASRLLYDGWPVPVRRRPLPHISRTPDRKIFPPGCPERRMPFVVLMTARKSTGERTARHEPELRIPALPGRADPDARRDPVRRRPPRPGRRLLRPARRTRHRAPGTRTGTRHHGPEHHRGTSGPRLADALQQALAYQPANQDHAALAVQVLQLLDLDGAPVEKHPHGGLELSGQHEFPVPENRPQPSRLLVGFEETDR